MPIPLMHALLEKDIPKQRWIETLNKARTEGLTGIVVVYFKNASSVSKTILLYREGEIKNTVYNVDGKVFLGSPSLLLDRWYATCEGVMDVYTTSEDEFETLKKNYEKIFMHQGLDVSPSEERTIPPGEQLGTLSLSLMPMEEIRLALNKKRFSGFIECECGTLIFVEGEAYAALAQHKRGFSALKEIMECEGGDVKIFRYPNIDAVIKVGIPLDAILVAKKGERLDDPLERIRRRIPTPEEIDEIMRSMAFFENR